MTEGFISIIYTVYIHTYIHSTALETIISGLAMLTLFCCCCFFVSKKKKKKTSLSFLHKHLRQDKVKRLLSNWDLAACFVSGPRGDRKPLMKILIGLVHTGRVNLSHRLVFVVFRQVLTYLYISSGLLYVIIQLN